MDEDVLQEIADSLSGTCDNIANVLERMDGNPDGYDVEEIDNALLDLQVERCRDCGWWFECCELTSDDDEECGKCSDCREEKIEDE